MVVHQNTQDIVAHQDIVHQNTQDIAHQSHRSRSRSRDRNDKYYSNNNSNHNHSIHSSPTHHSQIQSQPIQTAVSCNNYHNRPIATFDIQQILTKQSHAQSIKTNFNLLTYYHVDPTQNLLQCNSDIKPFQMKSKTIKLLDKQQINLNTIPIEYCDKSINKSLNEQQPSIENFNKAFGQRIDPLATEIQNVLNMSANNNNNNTSIVTFRRNLRAIASVILHQFN
eukprot:467546_1